MAAARDRCAFCEIAADSTHAFTVLEDELCLAFLDRRPLFPGHCLLIPKPHHATLPELPAVLVDPLFRNARLLSRAMEEGMGAEGSFVALNNRISQSVPHLHVHVVPRRAGDGLRGFFWPRLRYPGDPAMRDTQGRLREAVDRLRGSAA